MKEQLFRTRITDMLGIRHPILCGGLGPKVADARYVASAVNAGGMGFIVAAGFPEPESFREQLLLCADLTQGKPFGVNFYISRQPGTFDRILRQIEIAAAEGVVICAETAGAHPEHLVAALKDAGIKVLHKVPTVRYAHTASRMGVDGVIVVGNDCGGHPGTYGIGSIVQTAHAAMTLDIPVIAGGGVGTGRQIAAMLALGAEGVVMGTRMLVAEELWIHRNWKERIVQSDGTESVIVKKALRDNHRIFRNDTAEVLIALDDAKIDDFEQYRPHVMGGKTHAAYSTGDYSSGTLDFGPAAVFADRIEPMEAIFDRLVEDARSAGGRLDGLRAAALADASPECA